MRPLLAVVLALAFCGSTLRADDAEDRERDLRVRIEKTEGKERGAAAAELALLLEGKSRWSEAAAAWRQARRSRAELADAEGEARALLAFAEEIAVSGEGPTATLASFEDARAALRRAREAGSATVETSLGLARCAEIASEDAEQIAELTSASEKFKDDPRPARALAGALAAAGRADEAVALFQRLSDARPNDAQVAVLLSNAARGAGKEDVARSAALRAIEASTESVDAWMSLYSIYGPKQRWGEFAEAAIDAAKRHPKSGYAAHYAGMGCAYARRFDEALTWLEAAWTLRPTDTAAKTEAARILFSEKKDRDASVRLASEVLAADPPNVEAMKVLYFVGTLYYQEGKPSASVPIFETIARARPKDPVTQNNLANTYRFAGRYADAERVYLASIAASPEDAQLRNDYALLLDVEGRYDDACKVLLAAHEVDPTNNDSMENLAFLARARGDRDEALRWFRAAYAAAQARGELVGRHRITVDDQRWPLPPLPGAR